MVSTRHAIPRIGKSIPIKSLRGQQHMTPNTTTRTPMQTPTSKKTRLVGPIRTSSDVVTINTTPQSSGLATTDQRPDHYKGQEIPSRFTQQKYKNIKQGTGKMPTNPQLQYENNEQRNWIARATSKPRARATKSKKQDNLHLLACTTSRHDQECSARAKTHNTQVQQGEGGIWRKEDSEVYVFIC